MFLFPTRERDDRLISNIFLYILILNKRLASGEIYIYIYMLLGRFAAPQNGFLGSICGPPRVNLRPPLFETTVFIARNGFLCGFRKPNILTVFGFFGFFKIAILEVIEVVFFRSEQIFVFCVCFWSGLFQAQSKR